MDHKGRYFPSSWARYDEAVNGQLHLVPYNRLARQLRSDYAGMREMFFADAEPFDAMLDELRRLETRVNERTTLR